MKTLCIKHVSFEGMGVIESFLKEKNSSITFCNLFEGEDLPSVNDFDFIVIMGGPMGIYDYEEHQWLKQEKEFVSIAIQENKKILGICLGAQLIADCLGAKVFKNKQKEIGWFEVERTESCKNTFLNNILPDYFTPLHWHGDTFDTPEGAVNLLKSKATKNQAFLYKENVLGLQFHLEATKETLRDLIKNCEDELVNETFIQTKEEMLENINCFNEANDLMGKIIKKFLKLKS